MNQIKQQEINKLFACMQIKETSLYVQTKSKTKKSTIKLKKKDFLATNAFALINTNNSSHIIIIIAIEINICMSVS